MFVPNPNNFNKIIGIYNYKGKKEGKITYITNDIGYPIIAPSNPGNDNDTFNKIGFEIINDFY